MKMPLNFKISDTSRSQIIVPPPVQDDTREITGWRIVDEERFNVHLEKCHSIKGRLKKGHGKVVNS